MQRQEFYSCPQGDVVKDLATDARKGLTEEEAQARRARYGENKLQEQKKKSMFVRFLEQFKDVMIIILLIAACVSFGVICYEVFGTGEGEAIEFVEPAHSEIARVLNAVMGVIQESKAEKALEALKNMSAPHARVLRDGKEKFIQASELVPGDIIHLEAGDFVPADARLLTSSNLKSEESALTGESVPAEKDARAEVKGNASVGDRTNMVFSGCSLTYGSATAVVTGTGMNTEMGKIAGLLAGEKEVRTPLQNKLAQLGKYLGIVALAACAIIFIIGLATQGLDALIELFMTAVSLAVSAIPEGLPAVVTIVLSIGVTRMVKKNAIIKRLPAVETLGSASVICSDKTGTLTQNRMTLVKTYVDGGEATPFDPANTDEKTQTAPHLGHAVLRRLRRIRRRQGSAPRRPHRDRHRARRAQARQRKGRPQRELPPPRFPPLRLRPQAETTVNKIDGKLVAVVKGAFDVMAQRCVAGDIEKARFVNDEMSADALRVLAVGYKELDALSEEPTSEELEYGLTFLGLVGMIDPPRPEAKEAVAVCRKAGIKPVMITGDHVITASAIARELGILLEGDRAITGAELDAMSDEELDKEVEHISVYARVSPKTRSASSRHGRRRVRSSR